jgi:hypothetical protein
MEGIQKPWKRRVPHGKEKKRKAFINANSHQAIALKQYLCVGSSTV